MKTLLSKLKRNLPENKHVWKSFTMTALPVVFSVFLFALNSFVDNFMSINITGGNQALSYANAWTEIEIGIIASTTIIGTALFSQYVGKRDWYKVKEIINIRILFNIGISLIFAIPCIIATKQMIELISGFDNAMSDNIKNQAIEYLRMIVVSWILNAISFTLAMILREKNHGSVTVFTSIITLAINITLNSIFIYNLNLGIVYLAYSTLISIFVSIIFMLLWTWIKDRTIFCNLLKIFVISSHIAKQFFKRFGSFILFAIGSIFVNIRFIFWNAGYGTGTIGESVLRISAATILGITGMFFNIFWTTFESMSATIAVYVGTKLGINDIERAKINAKQLQGFHLIMGIVIALCALIIAFTVPYMNFLTGGYEKELQNFYSNNPIPDGYTLNQIISNGKKIFLQNIKYTLIGISVFIPMFVWFVSRARIIAIGGLTNISAATETIIEALHIGFLAIQCYLWNTIVSFSWAYFIFFAVEIVKLISYEIVYKNVNWARNITHSKTID